MADAQEGEQISTIDELISHPRFKCNACGGLTRFSIKRSLLVETYYHQTVAGDIIPETPEVLTDEIISVECVWCGHGKNVEEIERPGESEQFD
jgi:hypothetical protein